MKRIAIFASGSGTNFEALVCACENKQIDGHITLHQQSATECIRRCR